MGLLCSIQCSHSVCQMTCTQNMLGCGDCMRCEKCWQLAPVQALLAAQRWASQKKRGPLQTTHNNRPVCTLCAYAHACAFCHVAHTSRGSHCRGHSVALSDRNSASNFKCTQQLEPHLVCRHSHSCEALPVGPERVSTSSQQRLDSLRPVALIAGHVEGLVL